MNCLYNMLYGDLKELVEDVLHLEYWSVRDDELRSRMDSIAYSDRFKELKERATEKGYVFNDIEIVTWLDTLNILYYVFDKIEDERLCEDIRILQEYSIPYLEAMKRSVVDASKIFALLQNALTDKIDDREIFMKGIDYSYYYEEE